MLYYIIRYTQEKKAKNDALREIRRNGWRCTYFTEKRTWRKLW